MKKSILIACIAIFPLFAYCQKAIDEKTVPEKYQNDLKKKYPNAKQTKWTQPDSATYEASFKNEDAKISLTFTNISVVTRWNVELNHIPASIQTYIQTNYKNAKVESACIMYAANNKQYEVIIKEKKNSSTLLFELDGTFVAVQKMEKKVSKSAKK